MTGAGFTERLAAIGPTLDSLEIDRADATLVGGAGLAAYLIDTYRGVRSEHGLTLGPFDVDALMARPAYFRLIEHAKSVGARIERYPNMVQINPLEPGLLPFSGILLEDNTARVFGYGAGLTSMTVGGFTTLPASALARSKNARAEIRDTVGLTLGHHDAFYEGLEVADDPDWLSQIATAIKRADRLRRCTTIGLAALANDLALPDIFVEQVMNRFSDRAFEKTRGAANTIKAHATS